MTPTSHKEAYPMSSHSAPQQAAFRASPLLALVVLVLCVAFAVGCGGDDQGSGEGSGGGGGGQEPVALDLELDWTPGPNHVVLYWGQDQGFFEDAGIDLKLIPPSDPSAPLKLVAADKVDMAVSYEPDVMVSVEKGLGVKAVGVLFPTPLASFIASAESGVEGIADVRGKRVGYSGIPVFKAYTDTILEEAGLGEGDVEVVNVGFNEVPAILSGKVAAITDGYINGQAIEIEVEQGSKPTVVKVDDAGVPTYDELVFIANAKRLESDAAYADAVKRFLGAYYKAQEDAIANPDEVAEVMKQETEGAPEFLERATKASLDLIQPESGAPGCLSEARWKEFGDWMVSQGLLEGPPDLGAVLTNESLPHACGS
jgi:putative hydroxymethylpyrimidine transport system substrate-binding protein